MGVAIFVATVLCMAVDSPAAPTAFEFKDSTAYDHRPLQQYRAIEFRD